MLERYWMYRLLLHYKQNQTVLVTAAVLAVEKGWVSEVQSSVGLCQVLRFHLGLQNDFGLLKL